MTTRNLVPRSANEGQLGTDLKPWQEVNVNKVYASNNVLVFNNVEEMKASNKVKAGYTIKTLGFYEANDGGGADYVITNDIGEDETDEASIIALQNGLYAKLLVQDYLNVKQFGAKGDGITDDTEAIQKAIDNFNGGIIFFPKGIYGISDTIITPAIDDKRVMLDLGMATIKCLDTFNNTGNKYMINLGGEGGDYSHVSFFRNNSGITNGILDANGKAYGGILSKLGLSVIKNLTVKWTLKEGIKIAYAKEGTASTDMYVSQIYITGCNINDSTALIVEGHDNKIEKIRTLGYSTGVKVLGSGNFFNTCHPFGWWQWWGEDDDYRDVGFDIYGENNFFDNCYTDGFTTSFQVNGNKKNTITNAFSLTGIYNKKENTFLKITGASQNRVLVQNAVVNFSDNNDGRINTGYSGPLNIYNSAEKGGANACSAGFINCMANNLTDAIEDNFLNSCFSSNIVAPFELKGDALSLNKVIGNGLWKINNLKYQGNNFPVIPNPQERYYGVLNVTSTPAKENEAYAVVTQTLTLLGSDNKPMYYKRIYFGSNANPKQASSGWSEWQQDRR